MGRIPVVYSETNLLHDPCESDGHYPAAECADRVTRILEVLEQHSSHFEIVSPNDRLNLEKHLKKVHSTAYLDFLKKIFPKFAFTEKEKYILPVLNTKSLGARNREVSTNLDRFANDPSICIMKDTFDAAISSAKCALTGAYLLIETENKLVFALCRPPGHHCGKETAAGFCYLNNVAVATSYIREKLTSRYIKNQIAILDLDYHHGNGTQNIFYKDQNPAYISLHCEGDYPGTGFANEKGSGEGKDYTINYPLRKHVSIKNYMKTLQAACKNVSDFSTTHLIVSFGVDTFKDDPVGGFSLTSESYKEMGTIVGNLNLPTLVVMEGGYNLEYIGKNVFNFLTSIANAQCNQNTA